MPYVKKANRVLTVEETAVQSYLQVGYDQIDEKGKVVKHATGGRTVTLAEHNKVVEELEHLKETDEVAKELEELKKENKALKSENTKLKKAAEENKAE